MTYSRVILNVAMMRLDLKGLLKRMFKQKRDTFTVP